MLRTHEKNMTSDKSTRFGIALDIIKCFEQVEEQIAHYVRTY